MPKIKSAKKALRQNIKRRAKNIKRKAALKTAIKKARKLIAAKQIDEAKKFLPKVYKILDKSAKNNTIKKNAASRMKSRITKALNKTAS